MDKISADYFNVLADYLNINYFLIDKTGCFVDRNDSVIKLTNAAEHFNVYDPEVWNNTKHIMETRERIVVEETHKGKWFLSIKMPWIEDDEVKGIRGISIDITDRKKADIAWRNFQRDMHHDLRTPMVGIYSLATFMYEEEQDVSKKLMLYDIVKSSERLNETHAKMLEAVDWLNGGVNPPTIKPYDIFSIIDEVTNLNAASFRSKKLEINVSCPRIEINIDKCRIQKILLNLVNNAIKFTPDGGTVNIIVETAPLLKIRVNDTGIGIPEDKLDIIFDNFTKLKPSGESTYYTGSGTGLYIAREAAKELGGTLTVQSELGKGSTFTYRQYI